MLNINFASPTICTDVLASINFLALLYVTNVETLDAPFVRCAYISSLTTLVNHARRVFSSVIFSRCITVLLLLFFALLLDLPNLPLCLVLISTLVSLYTFCLPTYSSLSVFSISSKSSSGEMSDIESILNNSIRDALTAIFTDAGYVFSISYSVSCGLVVIPALEYSMSYRFLTYLPSSSSTSGVLRFTSPHVSAPYSKRYIELLTMSVLTIRFTTLFDRSMNTFKFSCTL